jgi:hypothetical protein
VKKAYNIGKIKLLEVNLMFNRRKFLADGIEVPVKDCLEWLICRKSLVMDADGMLEDTDTVTLLGILGFPLKLLIILVTILIVLIVDFFIALSCIEFKSSPRRRGR